MAQTIRELVEWLSKQPDQDQPVWSVIYSKEDIHDNFTNEYNRLPITNELATEVFDGMGSEWIYDRLSEEFSEALGQVINVFQCDKCEEYDKDTKEYEPNKHLCSECGESKDVVYE